MHRSPLCMLVLGAALAACSTRDDPRSGELLSQDSTLVARLDVGHDTPRPTLPDTCKSLVATATPAVVNKPQADTLTRQAYDAEILGNLQDARKLFRRASELDGTNKTTAYHLGRTSEALGDRPAAIAAYCRYLALAPSATESAEARQRLVTLSRAETNAVGATRSVAARPEETHRVAMRRTPRDRNATARSTVTANAGAAASAERRPDTVSSKVEQVGRSVDSTSSAGEVVASTSRERTVEQPSTAPTTSRSSSRAPSRTQSAGIGAAAGAILGAATGGGVKGAVIGAAAGGILGGAVGGGR